MCQSLGYTWDYVEQHIDLPRLAAMNRYWDKHPPVHIMVAAYLGYGDESVEHGSMDELAAMQF